MMIPGSNMADGGGMGSTPRLNNNQFGNVVKGAAMATPVGAGLAAGAAAAKAAPAVAKGAAKVAGKVVGAQVNAAKGVANVAGKVVGAQVNAAKAVGSAAAKAAPIAARAAGGAALANPVGAGLAAGGAAAYGASKTPGGKSIIKGAIQGAKGPNGGFGVLGAPAAAVKGAVTSQGAKNVASGAAKGGLIGALGGPVGGAIGAGIGAIGGLFSNRGMGGKPKAPTAPGKAVPNRATPYTVQKGDTLTSIAAKQGTTVAALRQSNPKLMSDPKYNKGNMIWSGTKINPAGPNSQKMKDAGKGLKVNKNMAGK